MFEKFTKKAIDALQCAQSYATQFNHKEVLSQHLLLGLVEQIKGVQAKILNFDKLDLQRLTIEVKNSAQENLSNSQNVQFSKSAKEILELSIELSSELNSKYIQPQHIVLAILENKNCTAYKILKKFDYNEEKIIPALRSILNKSSDIKNKHEVTVENTQLLNINDFFKEKTISEILKNAQSKLTTQGYEILGSEQILQSILENKDYKITGILEKYSINSETFAQKIKEFKTRSAEFENSQKQIIFTPNAFQALLCALEIAKELGSVEINAEHVILGILKSKKGIAYKILCENISDTNAFKETVLKTTNDKIPETLTILRLSKELAYEINCPFVGSEIILLGILRYSKGIANGVLKQLGINFKDVQTEVLKLIKPQNTKPQSLSYSPRAQKILEIAYETAQEHKRTKIKSENLLYAITKIPSCNAMRILTDLGTDILEIQQGIKQELLGGMDL